MKTKLPRILGVILTLVLLASFMAFAVPVSGNPGNNVWETLTLPSEGVAGGWVYAAGQTAQPQIAKATDGTLYAYADPAGADTLFKSVDGGRSWAALLGPALAAPAVDLVTSRTNANVLYVTDGTNIWKSADAGATFTILGTLTGAGISSIDVVELSTGNYLVVAAENAAAPEIWTWDESATFPTWTAQLFEFSGPVAAAAGDLIQAVAFSPNFTTDRQIVAVALDVTATDIYLVTKALGAGWSGAIAQATINAAIGVFTGADIAFPDNYNISTANTIYVGVSTGTDAGNVYMVAGSAGASVATALGAAKDIISVDVSGSGGIAAILAGGGVAATGSAIYHSPNSGASWTVIAKPPAGTAGGAADNAVVVMADDYAASGKAWVATEGNEGGVSYTTDSAVSWNQLSLINSALTNITDLAFSPDGSVIFLAGDDTADQAVWKFASNWERIYYALGVVTGGVKVSPDFATSNTVFFVTPATAGVNIQRSTDGGQIFAPQPSTVAAGVTSWAIIDANTLITGDAAGSVHISSNNGLSWATVATGAGEDIMDIVLSPDYATDSTILIGTDGSVGTGDVWISVNGGITWVLTAASNAAMTDVQSVAFDPNFVTNRTIYTTDSTGGIYRCVFGTTVTWVAIDIAAAVEAAVAPSGAGSVLAGTGIQVSSDGTLYVADASVAASEMVSRALTPTAAIAPTVLLFIENANDTSTGVVPAAVAATGLWLTTSSPNKLWTIDTAATPDAVYHYTDNLATAPTLTLDSVTTATATFSWTALTGSTSYQLLVNPRSDFLGTAAGITYVAPELTGTAAVAAGTTYYAMVRTATTAGAGAPVLSRWSASVTLTTQMAAVGAPPVLAPLPGAQNVILTPSLSWGAVAGAASYTIEIADNPEFTLALTRSSPINAWQVPQPLDYSTTYYWRVTAISATGAPTSAPVIGVFTTMAEPAPPVVVEPTPPAPPAPEIIVEVPAPAPAPEIIVKVPPAQEVVIPPAQPITPGWIYAIIIVGAVLVITVIVLIVRTRRVP